MTPHSSGSLVGVERRHRAGLLELERLVHEQRRVAAVVDDQRRAAAVGPHAALRPCTTSIPAASRPSTRTPACPAGSATVPPGLGPADDHRRGGVILRREDVAAHPAHVGAELGQRLDQHGGLHGHVQRAHDLRAGQRLLCPRSARAAPSGPGISCSARRISLRPNSARREVLDLERFAAGLAGGVERVQGR